MSLSEHEDIVRAAELLRSGGLVAFPTETVYGLGANALDEAAVARIYEAKGRPATSPLIVHVLSIDMARVVSAEWPAHAEALGRRFWPGPLTIVVPRHPRIPALVAAGLDTVAVRVPAHPMAQALLRETGLPIAAPSANRFTQLSPTTAEHVRDGLGDRVDFILDGGPTQVGIESTVISVAGERPSILRPGMISRAAIEAVIGPVATAAGQPATGIAHASPGLHRRHYSPRTPLVLTANRRFPAGRGAYLFLTAPAPAAAHNVEMPSGVEAYAEALYRTLHELDRESWDWIAVERPPDDPQWAAILDRLNRACQK